MPEVSTEVKRWHQLSLLSDECFELVLRVGLVPCEDHMQIQLQVTDPRTDDLVSLESRWHVSAWDHSSVLDHFIARLREQITDLSGPF
jgi:hypothetical protein